jgi:hypothetical protein
MKEHRLVIFTLSLVYKGSVYEIKCLKYAAPNGEVFYKLAIPSALGIIPIVWYVVNGRECKTVMGMQEASLNNALMSAVLEDHNKAAINPQLLPAARRSA